MRHYFLLFGGLAVLIAVGYLNVLAFRFSWYWLIWWFDLMMHFLGGLGLGLVLLGLGVLRFPTPVWSERRQLLVGVIGLVIIIGLVWEMFEFTTDRRLGNHLVVKTPDKLQQGAADTATDLLSDLIGVTVAAGVFNLILWKNKTT